MFPRGADRRKKSLDMRSRLCQNEVRESTGSGNINIAPVQEWFGHKDVTMGMVYSHVVKR